MQMDLLVLGFAAYLLTQFSRTVMCKIIPFRISYRLGWKIFTWLCALVCLQYACVWVCLHSLDILNRFHDIHLTHKVFGLPIYAAHMTSPPT